MEVDRQGAGKLVVSKHTTTITLLSPCIILILPPSGQVIPSSPKRFLPTITPCLPLSLAPTCCPCCRRCLQPTPLIHDQRIRRVRERDLFDRQVWLQLPVRRVDCLRCGRVSEHIDWLPLWLPASPGACSAGLKRARSVPPIRHVSQLTGVGWHTINEIDKRRLQTSVGTIELGEVRRLVMDEFALHKGHRYATVIMDAERTRVLWVGYGNSRAAIRPFEQLGERCQQIEAVARWT